MDESKNNLKDNSDSEDKFDNTLSFPTYLIEKINYLLQYQNNQLKNEILKRIDEYKNK